MAAVLCVVAAAPVWADEPPLFRLFLRDGPVVTCLGEYARWTRTSCAASPSTAPRPPNWFRCAPTTVDWVRTEDYTVALRAARYAEARGEHDFAELSGDVARLLNEVGQTTDNARRLGLALEARRRLSEWPARHHNYRASDVQQILQLVDDAISDFRAAAGAQQFDLALHATVAAPVPTPLLAVPTPGGGRDLSRRRGRTHPECRRARVAARGDFRDDRAIGRAAARCGPRPASGRSSVNAWRRNMPSTRRTPRLAAEVAGRSKAAAARADVRGVERALTSIEKRDARLGQKRPDRVAAILATVQADLDAARRLRLARDQWAVKAVTYKSYKRSVRAPLGELSLMARGLDDIKRLAGPTAPVLARLTRRAAAAMRGLGVVVPPTDLASVHALMVSAAQLAAQAVAVRQDAVASGAMDRAWQASSAAAGALMLLDRARKDLESALVPPVL